MVDKNGGVVPQVSQEATFSTYGLYIVVNGDRDVTALGDEVHYVFALDNGTIGKAMAWAWPNWWQRLLWRVLGVRFVYKDGGK